MLATAVLIAFSDAKWRPGLAGICCPPVNIRRSLLGMLFGPVDADQVVLLQSQIGLLLSRTPFMVAYFQHFSTFSLVFGDFFASWLKVRK